MKKFKFAMFSLIVMCLVSINASAKIVNFINKTSQPLVFQPSGMGGVGIPKGNMMRGLMQPFLGVGKKKADLSISKTQKKITLQGAGRWNLDNDEDFKQLVVNPGWSIELRFSDADYGVCFNLGDFKINPVGPSKSGGVKGKGWQAVNIFGLNERERATFDALAKDIETLKTKGLDGIATVEKNLSNYDKGVQDLLQKEIDKAREQKEKAGQLDEKLALENDRKEFINVHWKPFQKAKGLSDSEISIMARQIPTSREGLDAFMLKFFEEKRAAEKNIEHAPSAELEDRIYELEVGPAEISAAIGIAKVVADLGIEVFKFVGKQFDKEQCDTPLTLTAVESKDQLTSDFVLYSTGLGKK